MLSAFGFSSNCSFVAFDLARGFDEALLLAVVYAAARLKISLARLYAIIIKLVALLWSRLSLCLALTQLFWWTRIIKIGIGKGYPPKGTPVAELDI